MKSEKIMDKNLLKKIGDIAGNVVMFIFLAVCILAIIMTLFGKRDEDGTTEIFGHQMRIVVSDSMAKSEYTDVSNYKIKHIPINSIVFIKLVPDDPAEADAWYRDEVAIGDVLTFRYVYTNQVTITHRVVGIEEKETGGYLIHLEGDNKSSNSELLKQTIDTSIPNSTNYVIGEVIGTNFLFGLFLSIISKPIGAICIIILPCFIIILLEVLKIVRVLNADKKEKEQEEMSKKDNELEELRRQLAALQNAQSAGNTDALAPASAPVESTDTPTPESECDENADTTAPASEQKEDNKEV